MAKIVLRQEAIDDLNNIWEYTFEKWSESQADKYYSMLKLSCKEIGKNPEIGKEYDEIDSNANGTISEVGQPTKKTPVKKTICLCCYQIF
jgi:toxin ParE1/3/4